MSTPAVILTWLAALCALLSAAASWTVGDWHAAMPWSLVCLRFIGDLVDRGPR